MKINYRVTSCNIEHCRVTVFVNGQNAGEIVLRPGEWLLFSTAQLLAQDRMGSHYTPTFEDKKYTEYIASLEKITEGCEVLFQPELLHLCSRARKGSTF